ncbi:MAG: hypothetical protein NVSMB45_07200 [Ginsengibacter sp.]
MKFILSISLAASILFCSCSTKEKSNNTSSPNSDSAKTASVKNNAPDAVVDPTIDDVKTILARPEVPILCYHHIRENKIGDYTVSPETFKAEMKMLADSGYKTVLPNQLYNYMAHGGPIPKKAVMITFDDTDLEQFTIGKTEMDKYGFKGVYFIMTISINRPRYMTKQQLKQLSDEGHAVECHTWDHHRADRYIASDWDIQLVKPQKTIEEITGKPIHYFAFPFGVWNQAAIPELKKRGYIMSFILSTKRDQQQPLYTVRRIIVAGQWSAPGMMRAMKGSFH